MSIFRPFRYLDRLTIEAKAVAILTAMNENKLYQPKWPLDSTRVAEFLGLDVVWDKIIDDEKGKIAARIFPLTRLIEINEDILKINEGFAQSTIAHEIGHWVLHINPQEIERCLRLQKKGIELKVEPLMCRNEENLIGIEWQAQYFASCLLMPQYKLIEAQRKRNLTSWKDLYKIAKEFDVTISNLTHRLQDLGWIKIINQSRIITLDDNAHGKVKNFSLPEAREGKKPYF